jgi:outer membrane receptor protein involved in Fe transport
MGRAVVYRNVNVDELRYRGAEGSVAVTAGRGLTARVDAALLDAEDRRDPARVLAETYPSKVGGALAYHAPGGRFWMEYAVRRNGGRETPEGTTPVGDRIPAFTVHHLRGGVSVSGRHELTVAVENLTNTLYAEALNTGFFRPEPGRGLAVSWRTSF